MIGFFAILAGVALADGPEISQSRGMKNGLVVLWPRVVADISPEESRPLAETLQARLAVVGSRAAPATRQDRRPAPQRVCPAKKGCRGLSLGVMLGVYQKGCVAVGVIGEPDLGAQHLVPWGGEVTLRMETVPFRARPEEAMVVNELIPCDGLLDSLKDDAFVDAIQRVMTTR